MIILAIIATLIGLAVWMAYASLFIVGALLGAMIWIFIRLTELESPYDIIFCSIYILVVSVLIIKYKEK